MKLMRQSRRHYSIDDYLSLQSGLEIKLEYFDGEIFAMAGGSANHNRLSRNVVGALAGALEGLPGEVFGSDMRVSTPSGLYTYPDASIVCGERVGGDVETITNPVVLVEVLSTSTRDYDREEKFDLYRSIPTLRHYLLIEQSSVRVELRSHDSRGGWSSEVLDSIDDTIRLHAIEVDLPMTRVYAGVDVQVLH
jgi:Uma2 family endonuclease